MKAQCVVPEDIHTPPFSVLTPPPPPTHTHTARLNSALIPVWLHTFTWKMFAFVTSPPCNSIAPIIMRWLWIFSGTTCWTWRELYILHKESIQQCTRITASVVFSLVVCSWEEWCYLLSIIFSLKSRDEKIWKLV